MDNDNNPERNINYKDIQKMLFIFNALNDGWVVKKINDDRFEFTKDNEQIKKEVNLEECIKKYVKYNIT
jgi:hypothetical protein